MKYLLFFKSLLRFIWLLLVGLAVACQPKSEQPQQTQKLDPTPRRFFSDDSFWNRPIGENPTISPKSAEWIALLEGDQSCQSFGINVKQYTIPIYQVDSTTPTAVVRENAELKMSHPNFEENSEAAHSLYRQHPSFRGKPVPIPPDLQPSPGSDAHAVMVDYARGLAWDMWYVFQDSTGTWRSNTGMHYDLYGPGVFDPADFAVKPQESIHQYGPGRAAGVPIIAGTIMHREVLSGKIEHKLAGALRFVGYQEFVYPPAIWTDGNQEGGVPEGSVIQLDPALDLTQFGLSEAEQLVAKALQEYGMVIVDFAGANTLYAEGLWYDPNRNWDGLLRGWGEEGGLTNIPLKHYRVLDHSGQLRTGGDRKKAFFKRALEMERDCE